MCKVRRFVEGRDAVEDKLGVLSRVVSEGGPSEGTYSETPVCGEEDPRISTNLNTEYE